MVHDPVNLVNPVREKETPWGNKDCVIRRLPHQDLSNYQLAFAKVTGKEISPSLSSTFLSGKNTNLVYFCSKARKMSLKSRQLSSFWSWGHFAPKLGHFCPKVGLYLPLKLGSKHWKNNTANPSPLLCCCAIWVINCCYKSHLEWGWWAYQLIASCCSILPLF